MAESRSFWFLRSGGAGRAAAILLLVARSTVAPKVESIGALTDPAAAEALRRSLESKGVRVSLDGQLFCELWLRKIIPAEKSGASGTLYPDFDVSTAVGVIRFATSATDFRGQGIPPGLYTLRYALPPNDGSHLGVSDYPDFLVLLRAVDDPDPNVRMKSADLLDLSRRATGTRHPGVLSLTQPSGADSPSVKTNEKGHVILQARTKLSTGANVSFAVVIKGHAEQ